MLARLDVLMGGRVAEELIFGPDQVTSGASSDIMQATRLARAMVMQWGMSEEVGVVFHKNESSSEQLAVIDREVKKILSASYERATKLLQVHRKELDSIARALVDHETLSGAEIREIISGNSLKKPPLSRSPKKPDTLSK